jgi:zinc protease
VALAARVLAEPSLAAPIWQREQERLQAALKEADTQAATVAVKAFNRAVYGDHPYGHMTSVASLKAIHTSDMQAYLRRTLNSCQATATVVGALSRTETEALVNRLTQGLAKACSSRALPPVPDVAPLKAASTQRIPFDAAQAHVLMGQPGIRRGDPDYFPLLVGNYILGGGGFVSRLTQAVREDRGLSYSVYSSFNPGLHKGAFVLGLQTRPDQADQALAVAREVVVQFLADGPTEAELQAAKDNLVGGFALRIDSNRKLLENVANMARHQLPLDYLDTWTGQIQRLTVSEVREAMARHLHPERMATVLVGARP